jgi:hypothetical protein
MSGVASGKASHRPPKRKGLSDAASAFTHCVTRGENVMPDGSVSIANAQSLATTSRAADALDPIEILSRAYQQAAAAMDDTSEERGNKRNRIRSLCPKVPRSIETHFQLENCQGHLDWPAPYQKDALQENADRWLSRMGDPNSAPCRQARALLADWRAWNRACKAIRRNERGPALDALDEELGTQLDLAGERLVEARTTSKIGILLKPELAADYGELADELEDNPKPGLNRIVLGLIHDLKTTLGRR